MTTKRKALNGTAGKILAGMFREHRQRVKALRRKPSPDRADVEELAGLFEDVVGAFEEVCVAAEKSGHALSDEVASRVLRRLHGPEWELMLEIVEERRRNGAPVHRLEDLREELNQNGSSCPSPKTSGTWVLGTIASAVLGLIVGIVIGGRT